jgi:Tol biopolymer transport system component
VNRQGKEEPLSADPNEYCFFRISPDGKQVALEVMSTPKHSIWIWDVVRGTMTRLTLDEGTGTWHPIWTPDGKRIVYYSSPGNPWFGDLYWRAADGTGQAEKLASSPSHGLSPWSMSRDGKTLAFCEITGPTIQSDIGMLSMEGDHVRKLLLQEKYDEVIPQISPDGKWMAYGSNESGKFDIYVRLFPDVNKGKWLVSANGGNSPLWSPDNREIYYRSGDAAMAVPVETEPTFKPGKAKVLFRGTYFGPAANTDVPFWDIHPDGKRFLMLKEAPAEVPRKINIVVNWFEELKQRVPVK